MKKQRDEKQVRMEEKDMTKETKENVSKNDTESVASEENPKADEDKKCGCDELKEKIESLESKQKELESKLAKEKDDYIRLMAEFETFRRRTAEEKLSLVSSAASETIKGLLPVLDDCERAMALLNESSDEAAKEGTGLIYDKLMKYLKTKGLEKIDAKGKKFDTDFHEAVAQLPVEDADKKGLVYDVIETGYTLGGKILRYAKVVVGI